MISLFETIIEVLSVPLEKWDTLRTKYKIILLAIFLFCVAGIIIVLNQWRIIYIMRSNNLLFKPTH